MTLDELEALEREATPGPWETPRVENWRVQEKRELGSKDFHSICECSGKAPYSYGMTSNCRNAAFIAAFRNAAPALIAVVRAAKKFRDTTSVGDNGVGDWNALDEALKELEKK